MAADLGTLSACADASEVLNKMFNSKMLKSDLGNNVIRLIVMMVVGSTNLQYNDHQVSLPAIRTASIAARNSAVRE